MQELIFKDNDCILKEIIDEAFEKFYETRISNISKVPFMMYN